MPLLLLLMLLFTLIHVTQKNRGQCILGKVSWVESHGMDGGRRQHRASYFLSTIYSAIWAPKHTHLMINMQWVQRNLILVCQVHAPESSRSCQCGKVREKGKGGGGGGGKLREKEVEEEEKSFASEFNF